ncbi:hypothetical protein OROMI_011148 [Orobanche minor]
MESNGKVVSIDGVPLPYEAGETDFGEPGTNGQHIFYLTRCQIIPCDFIGVVKSQQPVYLKGELVSNHDELMSNFFAQPDALPYGKTPEQLLEETSPSYYSQGSLLLPSLNAYNIGQLLAIYEHRLAVEGFIWGVNSFDQWGVELGKSLATQVRKQLHVSRKKGESIKGFNFSTTTLLTRYLEERNDPEFPSLLGSIPEMECNAPDFLYDCLVQIDNQHVFMIVWKKHEGPHQPFNTKDCGYYVCRFMLEIVQNRAFWVSNQVFSVGSSCSYSSSDIDEIRNLWIECI